MDSKKKELISISKIKTVLASSNYLDPTHINENDKEPIWDGSVYVYKPSTNFESNLSSSDIFGRVPVQVKSTSKPIPKNKISFEAKKVDLENYFKELGAIFFVVYINEADIDNSEIYYSDLLPVKINKILSNSNAEKKISIELKKLPDEPDEIAKIFFNFLDNNNRQANIKNLALKNYNDLVKSDDFKGVRFYHTPLGSEDPHEFLLNDELYGYAVMGNDNTIVPLKEIIKGNSLSYNHEVDITIDDTIYYKQVTAIDTKDIKTITIGDSVHIKINQDDTMYTKVTLTNNLRNLTHDLEFILDALDNGGYYFDGLFMDFDINNKTEGDFNYSFERERLDFFKKCVQLLDELGCYDDINISDLTENHWINLSSLVYSMIDNQKLNLNEEKPYIVRAISIGNLKILVIAIKDGDEYWLYDYNRVEFDNFYYENDKDSTIKLNTSKFIILDSDLLSAISNLNFYLIKESFKNIDDEDIKFSDSMHFLLENLKASDISTDENQKDKLLIFAEDFSKWILDNDNNNTNYYINKLNHYQSKKRRNTLTDIDISNIILLEKESNDNLYKFAANLLLDRNEDALYYLNKLDKNTKDNILKQPISVFLNDSYVKI